jgi:purine-nucleoside phosphorylase
MDEDPFSLAARAASALSRLTGVERHDLFVVLGSGWASMADLLGGGARVAMDDLPGFPQPSAQGHQASFRSVPVAGKQVLLALGRVHLYEGHSPATVAHGVRTAAAAGCRAVVLTNAAGSLHPEWPLGRPVLIRDQINFTGASPLTGREYEHRFANMTGVYSPRLRALVQTLEPDLPEGVYVGTHGPEFESPAEIRAFAAWGADLVGMSTVLETIAAAHLGLEVLGLALATNLAAGVGGEEPLDIGHVFAVAEQNAPFVSDLLARIVQAVVGAA